MAIRSFQLASDRCPPWLEILSKAMSKMSALATYFAGGRKADFSKNVDTVGELVSSLIELNKTLKSRNPNDFGLFKLGASGVGIGYP